MRQKRITEFFPSAAGAAAKPPQVSSFMKLPPNVRMVIYRLAGIGQDTAATEVFIDLNCWSLDYEPATAESEDGRELARLRRNWKSRIPINLLGVSRAIRDEVESALYSSHAWGASASGSGGLDVLENLSSRAMKAMRCLLVSLTPCACSGCIVTGICLHPIPVDVRFRLSTYEPALALGPEDGSWAWEHAATYRNDRPLDIRSSLDARIVSQWERVCTKLSQHAESQRLRLYVRCAVGDVRTAERVAKPLRRFKSSLQELGVSFGQRTRNVPTPRDEALLALARSTVQVATYQPAFPFFDLPTELQLQILSFTHLVLHPFELKYIAGRPVLSHSDLSSSEEKIVELSRIDGNLAWILSKTFCPEGKHNNAALWGPCTRCNVPVAYFLVSKWFRNLALEVFYGSNRIVVAYNNIAWCTAPAGNPSPLAGQRPAIGPQMPLLHVLRHITQLTLVASIRWCVRATVDFTALVGILRAHAHLPSLTLELHTRDASERDEMLAALRGIPAVGGQRRRRRRHAEIYRVIVRHLREGLAARGLKAFLLYLWWEDYGAGVTSDDAAMRRALEREKEMEVMGAGYDSEKWGKEQQRRAFPRPRIRWY
jgi:hypothetical protein